MLDNNLFDLRGEVAIVTGACGGLGRSIVKGLAGVGAAVIAADYGGHLQPVEGATKLYNFDVTNPDDISAFLQNILSDYAQIDILVNAAGIAIGASAEEMSLGAWQKVLDVNTTGVFLCSQIIGRKMIERRKGKIINMASRCGYIGYPGFISYNVSKAGVISITKTLAVEWAKYNVNVNAIAPGFFRTSMTEYVWANEERLKSIVDRTPMGRIAEPEEIIGTIIFLSSKASDFITGVTIPVDGGMLVF
ncbi:MAG: SDR family oxidoreductase [Firmicutes bacterium]|nr:SDR family oxidoreductase [Bacillota bacterium]